MGMIENGRELKECVYGYGEGCECPYALGQKDDDKMYCPFDYDTHCKED
jgi:hypothetical protein